MVHPLPGVVSSSQQGLSESGPPPAVRVWSLGVVLLDPRDPLLQSERKQGFTAGPVYGRAKCLPVLSSLKTLRT